MENIAKTNQTDLAGDLEVASTRPFLLSDEVLRSDPQGLDDVLLISFRIQGVSGGDGDFPLAANGVPDGVVFARELDLLRCSGEGDESLSPLSDADARAEGVVCFPGKSGIVSFVTDLYKHMDTDAFTDTHTHVRTLTHLWLTHTRTRARTHKHAGTHANIHSRTPKSSSLSIP